MCSVLNQTNPAPGQSTTNDQCSVISTANNNTTNAQCTVMNNLNGGKGVCSAFAGKPPVAIPNQMQCSTIAPGGFLGPNAQGVCKVN
jgi:hypothetical protein